MNYKSLSEKLDTLAKNIMQIYGLLTVVIIILSFFLMKYGLVAFFTGIIIALNTACFGYIISLIVNGFSSIVYNTGESACYAKETKEEISNLKTSLRTASTAPTAPQYNNNLPTI